MAHIFSSPPIDEQFIAPSALGRTFHDALDVVEFAELGGAGCGQARCESWHLDDTGLYTCESRACRGDTLADWADDPGPLIAAATKQVGPLSCGNRWVVVEGRSTSMNDEVVVDEGDVQQFIEFRCEMARVGIDVVDAVIFDDQSRWWSICELLTGSTRWAEAPLPCIGLNAEWNVEWKMAG